MEKYLTVIRHAKSDWSHACADHARGLNDRGQNDAQRTGKALAERHFAPDAVFCSSALRAKLTLQKLSAYWQHNQPVTFDAALYLASLDELMAYLAALNNTCSHIALLGHNPGLTELCNYLAGDTLNNLPTCGVYSLGLTIDDWRALGQGVGRRIYLITPRTLRNL